VLRPLTHECQNDCFPCRYFETGKEDTEETCVEVTAHTKDGKPLIVELLLNNSTGPAGETAFIAVIHDITSTSRMAHPPLSIL